MGTYTKKPVDIEALQFDGSKASATGIVAWAASHDFDGMLSRPYENGGPDGPTFALEIATTEGTMLAVPGDWVARGTQGEFYPIKPAAFADTYEAKA